MVKIQDWDSTYMPDQTDRIALVTGANSGVGYFTALALARKHAHVILACRSEERGLQAQQDIREKTGNTDVVFMQLDIGSLENIRAFSEAFHKRFDHLDLLINNAGVMYADFELTTDGFEAHFGTNHLGPFYLTSLLFDVLKASKAARIVNLSSIAHFDASTDCSTIGYPVPRQRKFVAYANSKLAVNLFTFELDRRLHAAGLEHIKSIAAHPGVAFTNLLRWPSWITSVARVSTSCFMNSPETAALPSLFAATEESVQGGEFIGPGGFKELKGSPTRVEASKQSHSLEDATKMWTRSEELLHCKFNVQQGR